jgi:protein-S-isoprenylcysteine O-methyltransferase Ste14
MKVIAAAAGSAIFFGLAPGVVAGLIPWWLTRWQPDELGGFGVPVRVAGATLIVAGTIVLLHAFGRFVHEGLGTPAPVAPTEHLVVGGLYRYVRNPMYLAVVATIVGQALVIGRLGLLWYAAAVFVVIALFVRGYEEPTLSQQFGDEYAQYRAEVRRWVPSRPRRI